VSTPKEQWQVTDALVYSVEWIEPSRNDWGHYNIIYSYRVGEERFTGESRDYSSEQATPLHRDDDIAIRYCPEHPQKSYYPEAKSVIDKRLLFFGIGAGAALIAMLIVYFNGGFR
jgi:hypothetical protein